MRRHLNRLDGRRITLIQICITFGPALMVWPLNRAFGPWTPTVGAMLLVLGLALLLRHVVGLTLEGNAARDSVVEAAPRHGRSSPTRSH